jgi:hypothetical protein
MSTLTGGGVLAQNHAEEQGSGLKKYGVLL